MSREALLLSLLFACGAAVTSGQESQTPADQAASDTAHDRLQQGRDVLAAGVPQKAIDDYFDPLITEFESRYAGSESRIYSAQNMMQAILYSALPSAGDDAGNTPASTAEDTAATDGKPPDIVVLDGTWAEALQLKAYALIELGRYGDARESLGKAQALSPFNSRYMSEYAYTYQAAKDWNKSVEYYRKAAELAQFSGDDESGKEDLGRALRGEGFALIELGDLDGAEKIFKRCLKLDRKDDKARNELNYIKDLRKAQRRN